MKRKELISIVVILIFLLSGCHGEKVQETERDFFAMNTYITLYANGNNAGDALTQAQEEIHRLEDLLSVTRQGSEIYTLNHNDGKPIMISQETASLLSFSLDMAERTQGSFEPTIYPVLLAWGFTTDQHRIPPQIEIDTLLQKVDHTQMAIRNDEVTLPEGMQVDLGAVAKGYTGDRVVEIMKNNGITSGLINLGGNVQTIGKRSDGEPWSVGIRIPYGEDHIGVLHVEETAIVTSGGYENYFTDDDGQLYWHILNPVDGYPAHSGLDAVTVVGESGALCDALSTALFVMGKDKAIEHWRQYDDFDMILMTEDGELMLTQNLSEKFSLAPSYQNVKVTVIEK